MFEYDQPFIFIKINQTTTDENNITCDDDDFGDVDNTSHKHKKKEDKTNDSDDDECKLQHFKEMLCGLKDQTVETSKQVKTHKHLTSCYFEFIRDILGDYVPKRIHHKMVKSVLDDFERELDDKIFTLYVMNRSFDEVMVEEDGVVEDRETVEKLLDAVNKALKNMVDIQCY